MEISLHMESRSYVPVTRSYKYSPDTFPSERKRAYFLYIYLNGRKKTKNYWNTTPNRKLKRKIKKQHKWLSVAHMQKNTKQKRRERRKHVYTEKSKWPTLFEMQRKPAMEGVTPWQHFLSNRFVHSWEFSQDQSVEAKTPSLDVDADRNWASAKVWECKYQCITHCVRV